MLNVATLDMATNDNAWADFLKMSRHIHWLITACFGHPYQRIAERRKPKKPCKSQSEVVTECRDYLEARFGKLFPKDRPDWLRNPETGQKMVLDCYNEEVGIAVKYNGTQHYRYDPDHPPFGMTEEQFETQQKRDKLKKKLCKQHNVKLIVVPYNIKNIPAYLDKKLDQCNL